MGLLKLKTKISVDEYLKGEIISPIRREYFFGEVYPRADNDDDHNRIVGNVLTLRCIHLRNSTDEVFACQLKVCAAKNIIYYPDIFVAGDESPKDSHFRNYPILVVEVASIHTKRIDYREKLFTCQQIPTVLEYVLIDQYQTNIERHRRQPDSTWITYHFDETDDEIEFQSIGLTLPIAELYRRVRFETNAERNN